MFKKTIAFSLCILLAGCHVQRPGEVRPRQVAGCAEIVSAMTPLPPDPTAEQLARLTYCRTAEAAEIARATERHTDFLADMSFIGIIVGVGAVIAGFATWSF